MNDWNREELKRYLGGARFDADALNRSQAEAHHVPDEYDGTIHCRHEPYCERDDGGGRRA